MAKKDFSGVNTGRVYGALETAVSRRGQQGTASPQEAAERAAELRTQGRKGCKAVRINMAFTPENHAYIKLMARLSGVTMTEYVNTVVERYREEHPGALDKAMELIAEMRAADIPADIDDLAAAAEDIRGNQ